MFISIPLLYIQNASLISIRLGMHTNEDMLFTLLADQSK